jgi:branched-chain amino acid transport system permease protein
VPQIFGLTDIGLALAVLAVMYLRPAGLVANFELDEWLRHRWSARRAAGRAVPALDWQDLQVTGSGVLDARHISKAYSGVQALNDVSLRMETAQIVGLIGANGSGKSTLVNVLSGVTREDAGSIWLDQKDVTDHDTQRRVSLGLARTFQSMRLFANLTVRDNVVVAARATSNSVALAHELASQGGLASKQDVLATTLSYGDQRRLEIARALATRPRFLLLDEPAAGMDEAESDALAESLRTIVKGSGIGLLVVDHDMRMMTSLCHRLVVLDHGAVIAEGTPAEVIADPLVASLYLGSSDAAGAHTASVAVSGSGDDSMKGKPT